MFRWVPYVFVRVAIVFVGGVLLGIYWPDSIAENIAIGSLLVAVGLFGIISLFNKSKNRTINPGPIALLFVFICGYELVLLKTDSRHADHILHLQESTTHYTATVNGYTQEKENFWRVEATVGKVRTASGWMEKSGNVQLYFSKQDFAEPFVYGDVLLISDSPQLLSPPGNPGEFDYKRFLSFRKIYHQHFIRKDDARFIGNEPTSRFISYAIKARMWADGTLKEFVKGEREQAVASALVLGVTDGLDNDIMHAYSATGALHVLSVSGLHVGIIYAILLFFLKPIAKRRGGVWTIAIVSLVTLWLYAFVTGLSPSVLRAVTMFSFVAVARPLNRSSNIYNVLAASAFCLLLYEPYLIMSVGFQLSYLAVLGIVYLQQSIYQWWTAPTWLLDKIWQVTTVSIAAQLATVSLGLLYFHQFPVYFILSNLLVIPVSFAVLVLGLLVLAVSVVPIVATVVGYLLTVSIQLMNFSVVAVEQIPFSLLDDIYITTPQSWLIMGVLISVILLFQYKRFSFLLTATCFAMAMAVVQWIRLDANKDQILVYKVKGQSAFELMESGTSYVAFDSALLSDRDKLRFHIRPNRLMNGVSRSESIEDQSFVRSIPCGKLISWKGIKIVLLEQKGELPKATVDLVVIQNNAISVEQLLKTISCKKVILDGSNSPYFAARMLAYENVHSVFHHGAYVQNI